MTKQSTTTPDASLHHEITEATTSSDINKQIDLWKSILENMNNSITKLGGAEYDTLRTNIIDAITFFNSLQPSSNNDFFIEASDKIDAIIKELFRHPKIITSIKYAVSQDQQQKLGSLPARDVTGFDVVAQRRSEAQVPVQPAKETTQAEDITQIFINVYENFLVDTKKYITIKIREIEIEIEREQPQGLTEDAKTKIENMIALGKLLNFSPEKFHEENFNRWRLMDDIKKIYQLKKTCESLLKYNHALSDETKSALRKIIEKCESSEFLLDSLYELRRNKTPFANLPLAAKVLRVFKRVLQIGSIAGFILLCIPGLQLIGIPLLVAPLFIIPLLKLAKWTVRRFYYHRPLSKRQVEKGIGNIISLGIGVVIAVGLTALSIIQHIPVLIKSLIVTAQTLLNYINSANTTKKIIVEFIDETTPLLRKIGNSVSRAPGKIKTFCNNQLKRIFSILGAKKSPTAKTTKTAATEQEQQKQATATAASEQNKTENREGPQESQRFTPRM